MRRIWKIFDQEHAALFARASVTSPNSANTDLVFQFKISLLHISPRIWRRIQVRDCTLDALHEHIQLAMGWTNSHLHEFKIDGKQYGDPEMLGEYGSEDSTFQDSKTTFLSDIVPESGKRFAFEYQYDFGDDWVHQVVFERCFPVAPEQEYPLCVAGARACPPEDCGGVWRYAELVDSIRDRKHEVLQDDDDYDEIPDWFGCKFDPEEFDVAATTKEMRRGF